MRISYFRASPRSRVLGSVVAASFLLLTGEEAFGGRFRDAVINFVERNYEDDIDEMEESALQDLVEDVLPVEEEIDDAPQDLKRHVRETWGSGRGTRGHTERCPYCISVAEEIESRAPSLTPVRNRVPSCFMIGGFPYVSSEWGTLHRFLGGQTGPAEGFIWFTNGRYVGVGFNGVVLQAEPAC